MMDPSEVLDLDNLPDSEEELRRAIAQAEAELSQMGGADGAAGLAAASSAAAAAVAPMVEALEEEVEALDDSELQEELQRVQAELMEAEAASGISSSAAAAAHAPVTAEMVGVSSPDEICFCNKPNDPLVQIPMIACDACDKWYHLPCVDLTQGEANCIEEYACGRCPKSRRKRVRTTYKPKPDQVKALEAEIDLMSEYNLRAEVVRLERVLRRMDQEAEKRAAAAAADRRADAARGAGAGAAAASASAAGEAEDSRDPVLLEAVRQAMAEEGMAQVDVVNACGLPGGQATFSAYLHGKHVARLPDKEDRLRQWLVSTGRKAPPRADTEAPVNPPDHVYRLEDRFDTQDEEGNWYIGIVRKVKPDRVLIHYKNWNASYDEWVPVTSGRIAPLGSRTGARGRKEAIRQQRLQKSPTAAAAANGGAAAAATAPPAAATAAAH